MKAIYCGSFDPFTLGHLDIAVRAYEMFGELDIVIANNPSKKTMFNPNERYEIVSKTVHNYLNWVNRGKFKPHNIGVTISYCGGLIADYIEQHNIDVIVRGIRNATDLDYEVQLEQFNSQVAGVDTVYFMPTKEHLHTSSTLVRTFVTTNRLFPIDNYVSEAVIDIMKNKAKELEGNRYE